MEQGHHIEQTFVITFLSVRHRGIPKVLHKVSRTGIGGGEAGDSVDSDQALSVSFLQNSAVQRELATVVRSLGFKESLQPVTQFAFAKVLAPPCPVHRPVSGRAKCVVTEVGAATVKHGEQRTVKICQVGIQPRGRIGDAREIIPARGRRFAPKRGILRRSPARPEFVKGRQVIGGIGETVSL